MNIEWICDLRAPSGYGRAARADMRALIRAGIEPRVTVHRHDQTELDLSRDKFWAKRLRTVLKPSAELPDISIWQETPEFYRADPTRANVSRIEWETSAIVDYNHSGISTYNWVSQLNQMTEVWAASKFVAEVLRDSGVETPCHVIPHPVDLETFKKKDRTYVGGPPERSINKDRFTVLALFQYTKRKNPEALLTAWSRSKLGRQNDCALLLKTYGGDFQHTHPITNMIREFRAHLNIPGMKANVYPLTRLIHEDEMPNIYNAADVFLCTSYGEGFGLPVSEAMACGLPVVYTNATAVPEFAVGYPVDCRPEPVFGMPHIPWYSATQNWWGIDTLDLVRKLEQAYDDWKSGKLEELGDRARSRVEELHSDERVGQMLRERVEALAG